MGVPDVTFVEWPDIWSDEIDIVLCIGISVNLRQYDDLNNLPYVVANPSLPSGEVSTKILPSGFGDRRDFNYL